MEIKKKEILCDKTFLKNIAEVTQEYNTTIKKDQISKHDSDDVEKSAENVSFFKKYRDCLKYLLSFCSRSKKIEYDVNESQITKQVEKLKRKKTKAQPLLPPPLSSSTKTLVLDLDETLIHSSFKKPKHYDFIIDIDVRGSPEKIYVTKRFGLDVFLFEMSQIFQLVLFTAGLKEYTDKILKHIDPKGRIKHILYRQHCTILNKSYFIKNLSLLGRNLRNTLLVDDNSMAGVMNYETFYKIDAFYGSEKDRKLLRLSQFLKSIINEAHFGCLLEKRKIFQAKNKKPAYYLNHDLDAKGRINQSQSTEQSSVSREENTAIQLVKNIQQ